MKFRIFSFFYSLFFFTAITCPALSSIEPKDDNEYLELGIDYLDNLPENDYIIGPGDTLKVVISRDYPEIGIAKAMVDGEGTLYLPKLKRVYVEGLTIKELNSLLNKAYKKFVKYPSLEVEIESYRPIRVLVEGEVQNPGLQTLKGYFLVTDNSSIISEENFGVDNTPLPERGSPQELDPIFDVFKNKQTNALKSSSFYFPTIFDVIRESGGITEFSDLSDVQIIRKNNLSNGGGQITTSINFEKVLEGDPTNNIRVYDSDVIKIKKGSETNNYQLRKAVLSNLNPKYINVFVAGLVNSPGTITVSKASVLTDAIEIAGGARVLRGPVKFIRFNNDGSIDKRKFALRLNRRRGSYKNPYLKEGDLIVVNQNLFSKTNEVITEITSPFLGVFSTYGLIKAIND